MIPKPAASLALFRHDKVLLVKRGKPPYEAVWSLPGGAIEWGETAEDAARRECAEETGLQARRLALAAVHSAIVRNEALGDVRAHYVICVFAAHAPDGSPLASGDVLEACWFGFDALSSLPLTPGLESVLRQAQNVIQSMGA